MPSYHQTFSTFDDDELPPLLLLPLPQAARVPASATRPVVSRPLASRPVVFLGMGILSGVEGYPVEALRYKWAD
ncbi:MAG: hypothetical protein ACRDNS_28890 [Trebonia sp.]